MSREESQAQLERIKNDLREVRNYIIVWNLICLIAVAALLAVVLTLGCRDG